MTSSTTSTESVSFDNASTNEGRIVVLLVDDQPIVGEAVRRALATQDDIEFHYCGAGSEAVEVAAALHPTVIMQDLAMPDADGMDLIPLYLQHPALQHVPIIILSSRENAAVKSQAFAKGAVDYLVKLPDSIELIARIRHYSRGYINQMQRDAAYRALRENQRLLLEMNEQLRRLSDVDGLTGLSNRRRMDAYLEVEWARAARDEDTFSLLLIDVDDFKRFNDDYGHLIGDEVLKAVGATIRACGRRPADVAARYGGEEFAMILPSTTPEGAELLAEKVRESISALEIEVGNGRLAKVTVSIGGASTVPVRGNAHGALLEAADAALYAAKRAGKNRVVARRIGGTKGPDAA